MQDIVRYLDPSLAGDAVVRIGDKCYYQLGPTSVAPRVFSVDAAFTGCDPCQSGSSSSSRSSGSSSVLCSDCSACGSYTFTLSGYTGVNSVVNGNYPFTFTTSGCSFGATNGGGGTNGFVEGSCSNDGTFYLCSVQKNLSGIDELTIPTDAHGCPRVGTYLTALGATFVVG